MNRYLYPLIICLTLGLAPFAPEPHLFGKLRWVAGGAHGMSPVDWFDLVMHGAPWLYLIGLVAYDGWGWLRRRTSGDRAQQPPSHQRDAGPTRMRATIR